MRKTCLEMVYNLAREDERILFIGSDLGVGTLSNFREEIPERFFMEGISEAHVLGMAAGLALEGKIPYVNTIATFFARRAYEQIAIDAALHKLPIRLIANGGGLVYAPLGPTHQAIEDIALMRSIPNMTVLAPCDAEEMRRLMPLTVPIQGPVYIRLAKGHDKIVSREDLPVQIGKALHYREGEKIMFITTGITLQLVLEAVEELVPNGHEPTILHYPTIKPFDSEALLNLLPQHDLIVTVEEHVLSGGLGSVIAEVLIDSGLSDLPRVVRVGLPDSFIEGYGSQSALMNKYSINTERLIEIVQTFEG